MEEEVILEKASQVAYCSLKKLHCTPFLKDNGRVAFKIRGNVSEILAELQNNPKVFLLDFLSRLESVRSLIFSLKNSGKEEYVQDRPSTI